MSNKQIRQKKNEMKNAAQKNINEFVEEQKRLNKRVKKTRSQLKLMQTKRWKRWQDQYYAQLATEENVALGETIIGEILANGYGYISPNGYVDFNVSEVDKKK